MSQSEPSPETGKTADPQQSALGVLWNVVLYLVIVPGAIVLAVKWIFGA